MAKKDIAKTAKAGRTSPSNDLAGKKEHAYFLFLQRVPQKEIATRVGVIEKTIFSWKKKGAWEAKRAAKTISMDELINKALIKINELLESPEFSADAFAKAVAQLKSLKASTTPDEEIQIFMSFQNYLIRERIAENLSETFIKEVVRMQDHYMQIRLAGGTP